MENTRFPLGADSLPLADHAPRREQAPNGGCGCGEDGHGHHGGHGQGELEHGNANGCGCQSHGLTPCRGCVGHEGCGPESWGLSEYPLAMVYAPCQVYRGLYDPATALSRGTLFTELDLPLGESCSRWTAHPCVCRSANRERSEK